VRATLTNMKVVEMAAQVNQEAAFFLRGMARLFVLTANAQGSVDYEPLLGDSVVALAQRPAPTRWRLPTTPCWPNGPTGRATTARACCTSRSSTTATATCRRSLIDALQFAARFGAGSCSTALAVREQHGRDESSFHAREVPAAPAAARAVVFAESTAKTWPMP
jgi:hypothetical protein